MCANGTEFMADPAVYQVRPLGCDWVIEHESADELVARLENREIAIHLAVRLCEAGRPSKLVVQDENGVVTSEASYGADPCPPVA